MEFRRVLFRSAIVQAHKPAIAVMFVIAADQTEGQFITVQGEVDDALETTLVIIAKLCLQTAFEFSGGRIGDYIDCAAGGIAAKQGASRRSEERRVGEVCGGTCRSRGGWA